MIRIAAFFAVLAGMVAGAIMIPATAGAKNTRVSIADFQWSNKSPHIDLGESVTWDWIGPDTQHSVTGQPPNASGWDSDPGSVDPHPLGDSFTVRFNDPGVYVFQCRLHTSVRGTVTVSNVQGDPDSDPGPQAPLNLDFEAPTVDGYFFTTNGQDPAPAVIGPKGKGIGFRFSISEQASASADYFKLVRRGKGKHARTVRMFQGYGEWNSHIGFNNVRFGARTPNFRARPGKYLAFFRADDDAHNSTEDIKLRFEIKGKKKQKSRKHHRR